MLAHRISVKSITGTVKVPSMSACTRPLLYDDWSLVVLVTGKRAIDREAYII